MSNNTLPTTPKIMVIRHAEKPNDDYQGVTPKGNDNKDALIVKGWQRAGALAVLFSPFNKVLQNKQLAIPQLLYAAKPDDTSNGSSNNDGNSDKDSKSKRPVETITPLSQLLQLAINENYGSEEYAGMIAEAQQQQVPVLIAWQHGKIPSIANIILGNKLAPQTWPNGRFDLVWVFDLDTTTGTYSLTQVPQNLLAGDLNTPIT
ncbi:MAG: hypothetical protein NTV43_15025 [Methylococcales bacterium]|nr:hypothetical protein [Methylococcales bacterium]